MSTPGTETLPGPVAPDERIVLVDGLRGFALFGILVVNVLAFASPIPWIIDPPWTRSLDRALIFVVETLFTAKFYSLFAFLFGVGFAIQVGRAERSGRSPVTMLLRRYAALFAFGAAHVALFWYGDILHHYALLGVALLLVRDADQEQLLRLAGVSLLIPVTAVVFALAMSHLFPVATPGMAPRPNDAIAAIQAYSTGDARQLALQRWHDYRELETGAVEYLPQLFGLFLLGVWAGRARILHRPEEHRPFLQRIAVAGFALGIPTNVAMAFATFEKAAGVMDGWAAMVAIGRVVGGATLCAAYVATFALCGSTRIGTRVIRTLAPAGRMALTNYLAQSVIGTAVFYSWGLGLYGATGPAFQLAVAAPIFAMQIVWSRWWLARFRFGPMEWLWRRVTYGARERR